MNDDERGRDEEEQGVEDGAGHDGQEDNLGRHWKATAEFKLLWEGGTFVKGWSINDVTCKWPPCFCMSNIPCLVVQSKTRVLL